MELKFIRGEKNEEAGMLGRNYFVYTLYSQVGTLKSEAMIQDMYINDKIVPIDYLFIYIHISKTIKS